MTTKKARESSSKPALPGHRPEVAAALSEMMATFPGVVEGKMFGMPAFKTGGKVFACVYGDGVCVKLPADRVAALENTPGFAPFTPMGRKMKEWVLVIRKNPKDYKKDEALFREAATFVES